MPISINVEIPDAVVGSLITICSGLVVKAALSLRSQYVNAHESKERHTNPTREPQTQSSFFRLPLEIRRQIYTKLLTSQRPIHQAHKLIGRTRQRSRKLKSPNAVTPQNGLDATLLRTCHLLYSEALPILYESNTFHFDSPEQILGFQYQGLNELDFGLQRSKQGRLSLIRSLELDVRAGYLSHLGRSMIYIEWAEFVMDEYAMAFRIPRLRTLSLDFSPWDFKPDEGSELRPFIERFQNLGEGGLQKLVVKGVKHQPTLDNMREQLVEDGGEFIVEDD